MIAQRYPYTEEERGDNVKCLSIFEVTLMTLTIDTGAQYILQKDMKLRILNLVLHFVGYVHDAFRLIDRLIQSSKHT